MSTITLRQVTNLNNPSTKTCNSGTPIPPPEANIDTTGGILANIHVIKTTSINNNNNRFILPPNALYQPYTIEQAIVYTISLIDIDKLKKREYTIDELTKFAQKLGLGITGSN